MSPTEYARAVGMAERWRKGVPQGFAMDKVDLLCAALLLAHAQRRTPGSYECCESCGRALISFNAIGCGQVSYGIACPLRKGTP